jgi:hypothetical protein
MKKTFKQHLLDAFNIGYFPTKATKRADMLKLIRELRPLDTDKSLIRLGPNGDGGYLVPNDLAGIQACFSPGVSDSSDFELSCANLGMQVFMADHSVDGPATSHENFHFAKKFIGATTSEVFMTMQDWISQTDIDPQSDLLLQIDIEGYEYETFLSMPDALMQRFRIIVSPSASSLEPALLPSGFKRIQENIADPYLRAPSSQQLPQQFLLSGHRNTPCHGIYISAQRSLQPILTRQHLPASIGYRQHEKPLFASAGMLAQG